MKRTICLLAAASFVVLLAVSCGTTSGGSNSSGASGSGGKVIIGEEGIPRPEWIDKRKKDTADTRYFVGRGRGSVVTRAQFALNNGLQALSIWKEGITATTLKTYTEEYGELGNTQTLIGLESAIVTRAKSNTSGFREEEYWISQDGEYIGLYSYPTNDYKNDFKAATNTFVRNEAAAFAEFKADQAFKLLDSQLDKN